MVLVAAMAAVSSVSKPTACTSGASFVSPVAEAMTTSVTVPISTLVEFDGHLCSTIAPLIREIPPAARYGISGRMTGSPLSVVWLASGDAAGARPAGKAGEDRTQKT